MRERLNGGRSNGDDGPLSITSCVGLHSYAASVKSVVIKKVMEYTLSEMKILVRNFEPGLHFTDSVRVEQMEGKSS